MFTILDVSLNEVKGFEYKRIQGMIEILEESPKTNRGSLLLRFPDYKMDEQPLFMNKQLRAWYVGLMYNCPSFLYYLSDCQYGRALTDVHVALLMFSKIEKFEENEKEFILETKINQEVFDSLLSLTKTYTMKIENRELSLQDEGYFDHLLYDYTNGFVS